MGTLKKVFERGRGKEKKTRGNKEGINGINTTIKRGRKEENLNGINDENKKFFLQNYL